MKRTLLLFTLLWFSLDLSAQHIYINEIVASNDGSFLDEDGDDSDWIELYNPNEFSVSLDDYSLTDKEDELDQWVFPNISIGPNEYMVVFCSGKNRFSVPFHTNFKITSDGEPLILSNSSGEIVDFVQPTPVAEGYNLAKICDDNCYWERLEFVTPGEDNFSTSLVAFSIPSGIYADDTALTLIQSLGQEIRYTLDGSTPDANSLLYTMPIPLTNQTGSVAEISSISTSPYWSPPTGDVMQVNVVRARSFQNNVPTSRTFTKTYGIGAEAVSTFDEYPVFSIQTDPSSLFDFETGLYVPGVNFSSSNSTWTGNYFMKGIEWEREVEIEYFENGIPLWSQGAGIRISGGKSRNAPQKSLRLYARDYFGASKFNYPFFETKPKTVFDKLLLRAHFGCWNQTAIKDEVSAYIVRDLDFESQHARPCVVFINGEYWGLFAIRDYFDSNYIEEEFGIEKDSVDIVLNGSGNSPNGDPLWGIVEGDNDSYLALIDFMTNNDMSLPENYAYVSTQLDISSTIDYYSSEIYFAQRDWPSNNYKLWSGGEGTKWRYLFYDIDSGWGYQGPSHNTLVYASSPTATTIYNTPYATFLFRKLLESPEFVDSFLERYACLIKNEFSRDVIDAALDRFVDLYMPGMSSNIDRWHNVPTISGWLSRVDSKLYDFNASRETYAVNHVSDYFDIDFNPADYDCEIIIDGPSDTVVTGIDDIDLANVLRVYPNPAVDWIWVDAEIEPNTGEIRIFDLMGRLVHQQSYTFHLKVGVDQLSAGMYIVVVSDGKKQVSSQFIKK